MSFNRYFHDELTALRDLGKEFSLKNPRLAPFLADEAQDPDVERLLEGVAFLTGRLRQKLDDELPEITHSLMALLWPGFLRPVPSMSVVQFTPIISLSEPQTVKKGTEIDSIPVDGTPCRFRTCYDVNMLPLEVLSLNKQDRPKGASLKLALGFTAPMAIEDMNLSTLRFFLHGETHVAQSIYLWMFRYLSDMRVRLVGEGGETLMVMPLPVDAVSPGGFSDKEALLPLNKRVFSGYRLLQEYFSLPEKFHFIDIGGLEQLVMLLKHRDISGQPAELHLEFDFNRAFDSHVSIKAGNFRLHCTPVVNLFSHDAMPIRLDHRKTEYRLIPQGENPAHYEVFSIDKVEGWGHGTREYMRFGRFESFEHAQSIDGIGKGRYYRERLKSAVSGSGIDTYLAFVTGAEERLVPQTESVSIELTCSNRHLPTMLSVGDIQVDTGSSPEYASFENITAVTPSFTPPLDQGFHWRLIANMSLNYVSLCDLDTLRTVLSTYDYRCFHDRQQARASEHRLRGLDAIVSRPAERLYHGLPVRGIKTILGVKESAFSSEGDLYLFLNVLNEFFALYASINSFHELEVNGLEQGEVYRWKPRLGQQPLI
ncbi:MAG: type VI secretion system baseplate subunit TssF [Ketobacteraceae bacterium]|nr:type VI secretion system baseplate subunit TssF [Ketobacteraceae bacterium]